MILFIVKAVNKNFQTVNTMLISVVVSVAWTHINNVFLVAAVEEVGQFLVDNLVVSGGVQHGLIVDAGVGDAGASGEQGDGGNGEGQFKCFHDIVIE